MTDLSTALERERSRLDDETSDNNMPADELRVTSALLTVLDHELHRMSRDVDDVLGFVEAILHEGGEYAAVPVARPKDLPPKSSNRAAKQSD